MKQASRRPEEILVDYGFRPSVGPDAVEDFTRACKEGLHEAVAAWLDLGMSPDAGLGVRNGSPALLAAAEGGHLATIELLLARGANIEARDYSDDTAFRTALNWDHPEAARLLASRGASVEAVSKYGESTLDHAIREGKAESVTLLLELGANPSFVAARTSPMGSAIAQNREMVAALLDAGAPVTLVLDEDGETLLHRALKKGGVDVVDLLLERGASWDARDAYGLTPLDYALFSGQDDLLEKLLAKGATPTEHQRSRARMWGLFKSGAFDEALAWMEAHDISIETRNEEHETLLMAFAAKGHLEGVRRLLGRGADPNVGTRYGSPVGRAVDNGHDEVLAVLLEAKASRLDRNGTPAGIRGAIWSGHLDVARRLLEACTPEERARVAEHVRSAVMRKNVPMLRLLVEMGVPIDHRDEIGGDTPLISAVASWHDHEAVLTLLEGGADLTVMNDSQRTPLHALLGHYQWDESREPTLRAFLERDPRLDVVDWQGSTLLESANDAAKAIFARILVTEPLERGASIAELASKHSWATLAAALVAERKDLVLALVDAGVAVNPPKDVPAATILHAAVEAEDEELVHDLLARGADPNHANSYGATPTLDAAGKASTAMLTMLLDAGGDPTRTTRYGSHALHYAIEQPQHLPLIVARGASVDDRANGPLLTAAATKSATATEFLIAHGAIVDVRSPSGRTPLTVAIEDDATDVARLLIGAGASPTFMNRQSGDTPLTAAAKKGSAELVTLLLEKGGSLEDKNRDGEDVLSLVIRRKQLRQALAATLAAKDIDVSIPKLSPLDRSLTTPAAPWAALYRGDEDAVKHAIEAGSLDVNARDPWSVTPLMIAAAHRNAALVQWLLEKGADPLATDSANAMAWDYLGFQRDETIDTLFKEHAKTSFLSRDRLNAQAERSLLAEDFRTAATRGEITKIARFIAEKKIHPFLGPGARPIFFTLLDDEDLVNALLELGFSPNVATRFGTTPLSLVLGRKNFPLAEQLVAAGAELDAKGMLITAIESDPALATWLLERGADPSVPGDDGRLAIHVAAHTGNVDFVKQLLAKDPAFLEARDASGSTPLTVAIANWWAAEDVAAHLVERGADVNAFDAAGQSALHVAIASCEAAAARFLIAHGASLDATCPTVDGAVSARALTTSMHLSENWFEQAESEASDDDFEDEDD